MLMILSLLLDDEKYKIVFFFVGLKIPVDYTCVILIWDLDWLLVKDSGGDSLGFRSRFF
jgi:hypothetical protein